MVVTKAIEVCMDLVTEGLQQFPISCVWSRKIWLFLLFTEAVELVQGSGCSVVGDFSAVLP